MPRKPRITFLPVLLLALTAFCISGWKLADYYISGFRSQSRYEELAAMVTTLPAGTADTTAPAGGETSPPETEILPQYRALSQQNPHMIGWIQIEDTRIDYPVTQTPDDPEYYLKRDFDGQYSERGCIFADGDCNVDRSDNVILYGHHMADGSMFAPLQHYTSQNFWTEHPVIRFDSLTRQRIYEIFAVFRTTAIAGEGFAYHKFAGALDEEEFIDFVSQCKAQSFYDTGITPIYGDQLLCLSTCEYTLEEGRLVVAAVLKK